MTVPRKIVVGLRIIGAGFTGDRRAPIASQFFIPKSPALRANVTALDRLASELRFSFRTESRCFDEIGAVPWWPWEQRFASYHP